MNVIDLGYDVEKLTAQQKVVVEYLSKTLELADQLDHRKIAPDITGQQGMNEAMGKQKKVLDDLALSTAEYNKILSAVAISQAKQAASSSDAAAQLAQEREALKQRNAEVKNQAIVNTAAQGSIEQLRAALALLTSQYDKLSATERASGQGKGLQEKIKLQSDALKKLEADTGRYSRNVGNYTGAISILEKALNETNQKLNDFTKSGNTNQEVLSKLQQEQSLLSQVLDRNSKGFSSLTMEVRANERALATMSAEGMQNTEAFSALQQQIAHAQRELKEFKDTQKLFSAELPGVAAATIAAKGLAGAYAIGAGAAALFADGDEKVEKELQKLVAVMTILQGLNEAHELIEKRLAIAKIFSAAGTGVQTAALKVYTFFTEGATLATKAFRAVLISTGLGAILVLLSSFASSMAEAKTATDSETESLKDYEQAIQDVNEDLSVQNKIIEAQAEKMKEQVKQRAGSERDITKISQQSLLDQIAAKKAANDKLSDLEDEIAREKSKLVGKSGKENEKKLEELNKREQDILKEKNKNVFDILDDGLKLTNENEKEKTRLAEEGRKSRKASAEAGIVDIETTQDGLKAVYSDEKQSYATRLKALSDYYDNEKIIQDKKKNISLSSANLTPGEIDKINADNKKALAEIAINRGNEERSLLQQQKDKAIAIEYELFKSSMDRKKAFEQDVFNDDKRSSEERIAAYDQYNKNEKKLLDAEYQQKIDQANLFKDNQKEVEALEKEHQDKLAVLELKGANDRKKIIESAINSKLSERNINAELGISAEQQTQLIKLNEDFKSGAINAEEYDKQLKSIQNLAEEISFKKMKDSLVDAIAAMKSAGLDSKNLELQLQNLTNSNIIKQGELTKKTEQEKLNAKIKAIDQAVAYETQGASIISSIVQGQHDLEMNRIQQEMDANTKQKDNEINNITQSTLSAQDKAAQITIINAQAQAKNDALIKKKRDEEIKQARFDKEMAAFQVVINTAAAVTKFLLKSDVAESIAAGITGAVELGVILARPIPQYAEGTDYHPGGPAIVGEGKYKERVTTPSGETFIADRAMLLNLPAGSTVQPIPGDEINQIMYGAMIRKTSQIISTQERAEMIRHTRELAQSREQLELLKKIAAKDQSVRTRVHTEIDYGFAQYINNQVFGR